MSTSDFEFDHDQLQLDIAAQLAAKTVRLGISTDNQRIIDSGLELLLTMATERR